AYRHTWWLAFTAGFLACSWPFSSMIDDAATILLCPLSLHDALPILLPLLADMVTQIDQYLIKLLIVLQPALLLFHLLLLICFDSNCPRRPDHCVQKNNQHRACNKAQRTR